MRALSNKKKDEGMDMINERLEKWLKERDFKRSIAKGVYYASQLSFYPHEIEEIRRKYQEETDIDLLKIFRIGVLFHDFIQSNLFQDAFTEVPTSYKVNENISIVGRADILLGDTIIELKTTSWEVKQINQKHIAQIMFYLGSLKKKKGIIAYVNKKDFSIQEFSVEFSESKFKQLIEAVKQHYEVYENGSEDNRGNYEQRE